MTTWTADYLRKTRAQVEANHKIFCDRYEKAKDHRKDKELLVSYAEHLRNSVAESELQMRDIDAALRKLDPCPACGGFFYVNADVAGIAPCEKCEGLGYVENENG